MNALSLLREGCEVLSCSADTRVHQQSPDKAVQTYSDISEWHDLSTHAIVRYQGKRVGSSALPMVCPDAAAHAVRTKGLEKMICQ